MSQPKFIDHANFSHLQALTTPVWIFDVERNRMWWANDQGLAFWKAASLDDLRKRDFSNDSASVQKRLRQIVDLASDDIQLTDTWTLYPLGQPHTVSLSFRAIEIEDGEKAVLIELIGVLERGRDDDSRRLLEAARATSLMISTFSFGGELLVQNPASLACYGKMSRAAGGVSDLAERLVDPSLEARILGVIGTNETTTFETEVNTSHGIRTHTMSVRKGRDPITGNFVVFLSEEDVTERMRLKRRQAAEKEALKSEVAESYDKLRVSQERYELAVQTASIWDWDVVEDKVFMSPNLIFSLGYSDSAFNEKLGQKGFSSFLHPDDVQEFQNKLKEHLRYPEQSLSFEIRLLHKTGATHWFHCQGRSIYDERGNITRSVGLLTDVSERKKLEEGLLISQRMEAVGQLTGGIAHDFNNLLTIIQGNAELLEELEISHTEFTSEIIGAVKRGADLTRHLLAFAKRQTLIPRPVNLKMLIADMEKTFFRALGESITIKFQSSENLWDVYADQTQLEAAILNLALNSRDAMPFGGTLTITCENRFSDEIEDFDSLELAQGQYVKIAVHDTGHGMATDTLSKSFEPFFTTKEVGQGSGLGLSMVLGFLHQSDGDVRIRSAANMGTTVSLFLPKSDVPQLPVVAPIQRKLVRGNQEHIHILEDNQDVQNAISLVVASLGYQVTTSANVSQALGWVHAHPCADLFLVDILLPGGRSGVEFSRLLKDLHADAKVLFMSGYSADRLSSSSGLNAEAAFISKPFEKEALAEAIAAALGCNS